MWSDWLVLQIKNFSEVIGFCYTAYHNPFILNSLSSVPVWCLSNAYIVIFPRCHRFEAPKKTCTFRRCIAFCFAYSVVFSMCVPAGLQYISLLLCRLASKTTPHIAVLKSYIYTFTFCIYLWEKSTLSKTFNKDAFFMCLSLLSYDQTCTIQQL